MAIAVINPELSQLLSDSQKALEDYLFVNGKKYPTQDWVTIAEYCKRFDIANTQTVSNWIKRGIVPESDTITIEEYNNIRLIRAIRYQD
ncbi:hypothetical protein [Dyadobacter sp. CY356]|uniref:hypothetical protein n=1 Tax=Dyadobacter sp. CY356 TaxID=2906442 RepID=UPI001F3AE7BB|nr:hypothetical protein [Dyadobacter sp. CY356]MCF0054997.1 hypothetical protein [Dyadobacter sp. CY356]